MKDIPHGISRGMMKLGAIFGNSKIILFAVVERISFWLSGLYGITQGDECHAKDFVKG